MVGAPRAIRRWTTTPCRGHGLVTFVEASVGQVVLDMPQMTPQWQGLQAWGKWLRGGPMSRTGTGSETLGHAGREHLRCQPGGLVQWGLIVGAGAL